MVGMTWCGTAKILSAEVEGGFLFKTRWMGFVYEVKWRVTSYLKETSKHSGDQFLETSVKPCYLELDHTEQNVKISKDFRCSKISRMELIN
jgi:hypothetical protein